MVLAGDSHADFDTPLLGILYRYRLRTKSIGNTIRGVYKSLQKEEPEG